MDFDGDGKLDLISGSYDPGELYLFRGEGNGKFAAREVIKDKSGKPILKTPNQKQPVESFGSWMALADWDGDEDLDILVGTFEGLMFLRKNEGSRTQPAYATTNEWLKVGAKRLRVPGGEHANPVIADWDGDGRWDIVTGAGDGGVYWYRNVGQRGQPQLAPPVALVPKHEGIGYCEVLGPGKDPKPGIRSQIAVVDYDGDGKLDILLGDFCSYLQMKKDLTPDQEKEFAKLQESQNSATKELRASVEAIRDKFKTTLKGVPKSEWNTPENSAKWQKLYQEMRDSAPYKQHMATYEQTQKEMQKYVEADARRGSPDVPHGYVWLFRRR